VNDISAKLVTAIVAVLVIYSSHAIAQNESSKPTAPPQVPSEAAVSPTPAVPELPPADAKNFTAVSPKSDTVDAFLRQIWGYDPDRTWRVAAIQSTAAPGVSRVTVFVLEKAEGAQIQQLVLMVTPDGNHAIEGYSVIPFGDKPFAETRELLRNGATGPYRGSESKDLEMVEFIDLQCPHCKSAQEVMDRLGRDDDLVALKDSGLGHGPARYYKLSQAGAIVGFIGAMTDADFCAGCNKVRLTADGRIRPCLGRHNEIDLIGTLRNSQGSIEEVLERAIAAKPKDHEFRECYQPGRPMTAIGG